METLHNQKSLFETEAFFKFSRFEGNILKIMKLWAVQRVNLRLLTLSSKKPMVGL